MASSISLDHHSCHHNHHSIDTKHNDNNIKEENKYIYINLHCIQEKNHEATEFSIPLNVLTSDDLKLINYCSNHEMNRHSYVFFNDLSQKLLGAYRKESPEILTPGDWSAYEIPSLKRYADRHHVQHYHVAELSYSVEPTGGTCSSCTIL